MFRPDDHSMFGLRSHAISHALKSVLKAIGDGGSIKGGKVFDIGKNFDTDAYTGVHMSCNSYYDSMGTDIDNCDNILINLRSGTESAFFIDIFQDEISLGVCGSRDVKYTTFFEFKDLNVLRSGSEEARFQHSTLWSTGDLTTNELDELLQIAELITIGKGE